MKFLKAIILLTISNYIFSQETITYDLEIDYAINYNTESPKIKKGKLYVSKQINKSIFIYGNNTESNIEKVENDNLTYNITMSGVEKFVYTDMAKDSLFTKEKIFRDKYLVHEKTPLFNWNLQNDKKELNGIVLRKATLSFRGRDYIAWYTEDYPIKFGPWKFQGLPGLIIEIYDTSKRYHWYVTSIKRNKAKKLNIKALFNGLQKISLREYPGLRYNKNNNVINAAKLPRGVRLTSFNSEKIRRNGIEIKFEWEEEEAKKD